MGFVGLGNDTRRVDQRGSRETEKNGVISGGRDSVKRGGRKRQHRN